MIERRHSPRFKSRLAVKFKIVNAETKVSITNDVGAYTEDISKTGMRLEIPREWDCPECNNCLGWIYNQQCHLRNGHTNGVDHLLTSKLNLKILLSSPQKPRKEPIELDAQCVWANQDIESNKSTYPVGICLSGEAQKKLSSRLDGILNP